MVKNGSNIEAWRGEIIIADSFSAVGAPHGIAPRVYCAANPLRFTDPSGMKVKGARKEDAAQVVEDLRAMFPGESFAKFRNLIVQSGKNQDGKTLAKISQEDLSTALEGVKLSEDQKYLVGAAVEAINSKPTRTVEYGQLGVAPSSDTQNAYYSATGQLDPATGEIIRNLLYFEPYAIIDGLYNFNGEGSTLKYGSGSISVFCFQEGFSQDARIATVGHELFGHGFLFCKKKYSETSHHVFPIQVENTIYRNLGSKIQKDGTNHGPKYQFIDNYNSLPVVK